MFSSAHLLPAKRLHSRVFGHTGSHIEGKTCERYWRCPSEHHNLLPLLFPNFLARLLALLCDEKFIEKEALNDSLNDRILIESIRQKKFGLGLQILKFGFFRLQKLECETFHRSLRDALRKTALGRMLQEKWAGLQEVLA